MDIKTKYEIGQRIWCVYEHKQEVCVYDDTISSVIVEKERNVLYVRRKL